MYSFFAATSASPDSYRDFIRLKDSKAAQINCEGYRSDEL